jgi:S1-C subfamily serine protease
MKTPGPERNRRYSSPVRAGQIAAVVIVAAVLGGGAALGIGKGAGWLDNETKTVVVKPQASKPAALPAAASSTVPALPGNGFDPQRIFAERSPGVVTIFAYFGDPSSDDAQVSQGSGFVISPRGFILTNSHVITNAGETSSANVKSADHVFIEFSDRDRAPAEVVGWDLYDDVGVLRVSPRAHVLSPVPLGKSSTVTVGQPVAAIGSPLGNENTLTVGVVSAIHRSIDALTVRRYKIVDAIQTDAPITHGNSGGPLFDARGRVVGINAQIDSAGGRGNDSGIGFAIPIDAAKNSVSQLIAKGSVTYAYVGITTDDMTPSLARALGYKVDHGALIVGVNPGSPANVAGLRGGDREVDVLGIRDLATGGDVIVDIDGTPVQSADDVVRIVSFALKPNDVAIFTVIRDGKRKSIALTLSERRLPPG